MNSQAAPATVPGPEIVVLPPEGEAVLHAPKGAVVQVGSKNPSRGRSTVPSKQELEIHKLAFDFWLSLGSERSFEAVATHFNFAAGTVRNWSAAFGWMKRLKEHDSRSDLEIADRLNIKALRMKAESFFEPDPENPGKMRDSGMATMSTLKDHRAAVNAAKEIRLKEQEAAKRGSGDGSGSARGNGGVLVNVIIQNKNAG